MTAAVKVVRIPQDPVVVNQLMSEGMSTPDVTAYLDGVVDELINEIKIMIAMKNFTHVVGCMEASMP